MFFPGCSLVISISGQVSRPIFRILTYNWIFKTNSKRLVGRSSWKANGLCEVQELWSDAVIWSAIGASDRPSLIMNDRSDIYPRYKSSCFNYRGNRQNLHENMDFNMMMGWIHQGCQLSKSSESFVVCTKLKPNVSYFVAGVQESWMKFSLVTMMKRKVICKALSGWGPIEGYWGGSDWLPRFFCSQTLYLPLPPLFTQPTTASSALPAFRSGMRCDNTNSIGIFYQFIRPYFCHQSAYSWKVFYLKVRQQALVKSKKVQMIFTSIPVSSSRSSIKC